MIKEVEIKFFLGSDVDFLRKNLKIQGIKTEKKSFQKDVYYTSKHKDFIISEECLRIRTSDDYTELTWKPPTSGEMVSSDQYWKEELNILISDSIKKHERLLEALDFIKYVEVKKDREKYRFDSESIICLDFIYNLGWFVEIETFSENEKDAIAKNNKIANMLNLTDFSIVNTPYRDLVKSSYLNHPTK